MSPTPMPVGRSGTLAADAYRQASDLLGFKPGTGVRLLDGWVGAITNGLTFIYGAEVQPATADAGTPMAANAGVTWSSYGLLWMGLDLDKLWVRNTTAGSNGTLVVNGVGVRP